MRQPSSPAPSKPPNASAPLLPPASPAAPGLLPPASPAPPRSPLGVDSIASACSVAQVKTARVRDRAAGAGACACQCASAPCRLLSRLSPPSPPLSAPEPAVARAWCSLGAVCDRPCWPAPRSPSSPFARVPLTPWCAGRTHLCRFIPRMSRTCLVQGLSFRGGESFTDRRKAGRRRSARLLSTSPSVARYVRGCASRTCMCIDMYMFIPCACTCVHVRDYPLVRLSTSRRGVRPHGSVRCVRFRYILLVQVKKRQPEW